MTDFIDVRVSNYVVWHHLGFREWKLSRELEGLSSRLPLLLQARIYTYPPDTSPYPAVRCCRENKVVNLCAPL